MVYRAVLLDAFGTVVRIKHRTHPYRKLLREGVKAGRPLHPEDARTIMTLDGGLSEAARHFGIGLSTERLAELELALEQEVSSIEAFADAQEAIALLQQENVLVGMCSNLAQPYGEAIKHLVPALDGYAFSFETGLTKPDAQMYRIACQLIGVKPGASLLHDRVAMIGDSLRSDCFGPRVGITGTHLTRSGTGLFTNLVDFAKQVLFQRA